MAIRKIKPTTPGQRGMTVSAFEEITCTKPERSLLEDLKSTGGRNNAGRITVRHRGGGAKRKYRVIDFKRNKDGIPAKVATIEYDPNLQVGDSLLSGEGADIKVGNALQIKNIPVGAMIHCIELKPGKGAQLVRSAGNAAQLMAKEGKYAQVRLPSGEVRRIPMDAKATIGQVGNVDHANIMLGKAGRTRHLGFRPTVRGSVMNPCDHPHGGGEGKSPVGRPGPVTPWGKPALGYKTRKTKNVNDKFIVRRRDGK